MTRILSSLLVASAFALVLFAAPAQAQSSRTFVSAAIGNDANDCSRPTPCRTFQGAHDKTLDLGEITVLDPGGYGSLTITKSISVVNYGVGEASILVSGGGLSTGITVNGGSASYINLRGITVQGIGFGGGTGMVVNSGFALTVSNCVFRNHTGNGIVVLGNGSASMANLSIFDTLSADNGFDGIDIIPRGAVTMKVDIDRVRLVNNSEDGLQVSGGEATGTIKATVTDSVSASNGRHGFVVVADPATAASSLTVVRSVSANNGDVGVIATGGGPATLRAGQSAITGNATTFIVQGGSTLQSFGDNYIAGNADGDPSPPVIARK